MSIYEVILLTLIAALVASFAQLQFKRSVGKIGSLKHLIRLITNKGVVLGLVCYATALGLYLTALSGGQLSIVFPVFASSFIFVTILSALTLNEKITAMRALGVLLVFIGVAIVAVS